MRILSVTTVTREQIENLASAQDGGVHAFSSNLYIDLSHLGDEQKVALIPLIGDSGFKIDIDDINDGDRERLPLAETAHDIYDFASEITNMIINRDYDVDLISERDNTRIRLCLQKIDGELAEMMFNEIPAETESVDAPEEPEYDPNKLYVQLVNGTLAIPREAINWNDVVADLDNIAQFPVQIKQLIHDLYIVDDENLSVLKEHINSVIEKEKENINMSFNYDGFRDVTERENLVLQLIDLNAIYEQVILVASQLRIMPGQISEPEVGIDIAQNPVAITSDAEEPVDVVECVPEPTDDDDVIDVPVEEPAAGFPADISAALDEKYKNMKNI